jgi:hypothetical protein
MKAREVSVSVVDFGGSLYVNITLKLPGHSLEMEDALPPETRNSGKDTSHRMPDKRVKESSRKRKSKDLQRIIEGIEFPEKE